MSALPSSAFTLPTSTNNLFPFIEIEGDLVPSADRPERVIYEGTDGVGFWFNGERGEPFTITSICDFTSKANAFTAFGSYLSKVGFELNLYYLGSLWGAILVHDVTLSSVKQLATIVGGINTSNGSSGALLRATWKIETKYKEPTP